MAHQCCQTWLTGARRCCQISRFQCRSLTPGSVSNVESRGGMGHGTPVSCSRKLYFVRRHLNIQTLIRSIGLGEWQCLFPKPKNVLDTGERSSELPPREGWASRSCLNMRERGRPEAMKMRRTVTMKERLRKFHDNDLNVTLLYIAAGRPLSVCDAT